MEPQHRRMLDEVRRIVLDGVRGHEARVYLFGSWARGKQRRTSDIDVAVWPSRPLPPGVLAQLRERLEESTVPYPVEVVDLSDTDETFRRRVTEEGILWAG